MQYSVKLNIYVRKENYTPIQNEHDLYRLLALLVVKQNLDRNGIRHRRRFWVAAKHLLVLDFDDAKEPHRAEQLAFKLNPHDSHYTALQVVQSALLTPRYQS